MSLPTRFLPEAEDELDEAHDWYEAIRPGLGDALVNLVDAIVLRVAQLPTLHQIVYRDVRRAVVRGYPYVVLYREDAGELIVVAVFHTSRDPAIWQGRI